MHGPRLFRFLMLILSLLAAGPASAAVEGLEANGPNPALADQLKLFGQFVGNWDCEVLRYQDGQAQQRSTGEWHFGWVLDGRAVQDVFIVPARSDGGQPREWGSSLRSFDPKTGTWFIAWVGPVQGTLQTFTAKQHGDEIVHDGVTPDGRPSRWVFSEIRTDSFRWRSMVSPDRGSSWNVTQEIVARRRK
ncbi:MAG: hypothetical protein JWM77_997 [Rhodospirillales bacterium]|nr:hypothetical protein [Rhodospirillales bacterium]